MSYKSRYLLLKESTEKSGTIVCDYKDLGYVFKTTGCYAIFINSNISYKKKLYVLAHELGHITSTMKKQPKEVVLDEITKLDGSREVLVYSKTPQPTYYGEGSANRSALKILKELGLRGFKKDYYKFYYKQKAKIEARCYK